jgi:hypothetical protein
LISASRPSHDAVNALRIMRFGFARMGARDDGAVFVDFGNAAFVVGVTSGLNGRNEAGPHANADRAAR